MITGSGPPQRCLVSGCVPPVVRVFFFLRPYFSGALPTEPDHSLRRVLPTALRAGGGVCPPKGAGESVAARHKHASLGSDMARPMSFRWVGWGKGERSLAGESGAGLMGPLREVVPAEAACCDGRLFQLGLQV